MKYRSWAVFYFDMVWHNSGLKKECGLRSFDSRSNFVNSVSALYFLWITEHWQCTLPGLLPLMPTLTWSSQNIYVTPLPYTCCSFRCTSDGEERRQPNRNAGSWIITMQSYSFFNLTKPVSIVLVSGVNLNLTIIYFVDTFNFNRTVKVESRLS